MYHISMDRGISLVIWNEKKFLRKDSAELWAMPNYIGRNGMENLLFFTNANFKLILSHAILDIRLKSWSTACDVTKATKNSLFHAALTDVINDWKVVDQLNSVWYFITTADNPQVHWFAWTEFSCMKNHANDNSITYYAKVPWFHGSRRNKGLEQSKLAIKKTQPGDLIRPYSFFYPSLSRFFSSSAYAWASSWMNGHVVKLL